MHDWIKPGGLLVLVVDDDVQIRSYIKVVLEAAEFRVLEAVDGLNALEVFAVWRSRIDLVITDIRMPRMTGTDLARSLRSRRPAIPLLFVSGEPASPALNDPGKGFSSRKTVWPEGIIGYSPPASSLDFCGPLNPVCGPARPRSAACIGRRALPAR